MYALYSDIPKGIKVNNILHIVEASVYPTIKHNLLSDFIYTRMQVFKPGLTIMHPKVLNDYSTVVVHDTPNRQKFWSLINSEMAIRSRLLQLAKSKSGTYVGIGFGAELVQEMSSEIKGHYSTGTSLSIPFLGATNKRLLFKYKRYITVRTQLLDLSRNADFYCFPMGTGYDSNTKKIIGEYIFLYRDGKEYAVLNNPTTNHKHQNLDVLNGLSEVDSRLVYKGGAPYLTWGEVQW